LGTSSKLLLRHHGISHRTSLRHHTWLLVLHHHHLHHTHHAVHLVLHLLHLHVVALLLMRGHAATASLQTHLLHTLLHHSHLLLHHGHLWRLLGARLPHHSHRRACAHATHWSIAASSGGDVVLLAVLGEQLLEGVV